MLAGDLGAGRSGALLRQHHVEGGAGEGPVEAGVADGGGVRHAVEGDDQFVAGAEGEVRVEILVAGEVELGRQLP